MLLLLIILEMSMGTGLAFMMTRFLCCLRSMEDIGVMSRSASSSVSSASLLRSMVDIKRSCLCQIRYRCWRHHTFSFRTISFEWMHQFHPLQKGKANVKYINLTLNAPIATKVVCFSRLLKCLRSLYGKQCGPRSDRSSLFSVHVCFYT